MDTSTTTAIQTSNKIETDWLLSNFAHFEKSLNGGAKLPMHAKRKAALANYQRLGFPTSKQEEWKYTNPAAIKEKSFPLISKKQDLSASVEEAKQLLIKEPTSIGIIIINGLVAYASEGCPGLKITSLKDVQHEKNTLSELIEKHLACHTGSDDAFVAMNTSLMENAIIIHVEKGAKISSPVEILFYTNKDASQKTILPRILVVAEANSESSFIEQYANHSDDEYCSNSVVEFVGAENSCINHYRLQNESINAFHVSTIAASLSDYANFNTHTFSFGGGLVRNNVNITLNGPSCNVVMNGLTAITGKQHVDNHTLLDNTKPHCESNELYKGIYADASQGVFSGSIIVRQDAQKTNAIQSNRSLLLSDEASINTKPQLKIWADDVKCTHGATIGQLDEDAMFYIRSRGVSEQDAKVMLIHAFASEVISGVKIPALKEKLEELLLLKLNLGC